MYYEVTRTVRFKAKVVMDKLPSEPGELVYRPRIESMTATFDKEE